MKGDITRNTFDAHNHFSRVLMQQGRVQLDADWNEQAAILLHYLQTLAADLIGPHGGPAESIGFKIDVATDTGGNKIQHDFAIGPGRYYVDGILCENDEARLTYKSQTDFPVSKTAELNGTYLVYLDVWERHLTYVEQENPDGSVISIREVALNGPDTASRAKVVWQVKVQVKVMDGQTNCPDQSAWDGLVETWQPKHRGQLRASARTESTSDDKPCFTPPESRYRGAENQLYRVEIHKGRTATEGATFKWSRENGSVIFPVRKITGERVELETLGRDARLGLQEGDWVELVNDDYTLLNKAEALLQVITIDRDRNVVTLLADKNAPSTVSDDQTRHPFLRRWDQSKREDNQVDANGVPIVEGEDIELEDGVQIQFQPSGNPPMTYRTGDYWLIPARTATGDVEWPGPKGDPEAREPHGVTHHYAPLAVIDVPGGQVNESVPDRRRPFRQIWALTPDFATDSAHTHPK